MNRWVPVLCLLASIAVTVPLAVWVERCASRRRDRKHPLAPVVPLRTGHVRVVPEPRNGKGWSA